MIWLSCGLFIERDAAALISLSTSSELALARPARLQARRAARRRTVQSVEGLKHKLANQFERPHLLPFELLF